jgi:hypothetical protein
MPFIFQEQQNNVQQQLRNCRLALEQARKLEATSGLTNQQKQEKMKLEVQEQNLVSQLRLQQEQVASVHSTSKTNRMNSVKTPVPKAKPSVSSSFKVWRSNKQKHTSSRLSTKRGTQFHSLPGEEDDSFQALLLEAIMQNDVSDVMDAIEPGMGNVVKKFFPLIIDARPFNVIATALKSQDRIPETEDARDVFLANIHSHNIEVSNLSRLSQHIRTVYGNLQELDAQAEADFQDAKMESEAAAKKLSDAVAYRERSRRLLTRMEQMQDVTDAESVRLEHVKQWRKEPHNYRWDDHQL